jgi:hypothetical protein
LNALAQWQFRPAVLNGKVAAVERSAHHSRRAGIRAAVEDQPRARITKEPGLIRMRSILHS